MAKCVCGHSEKEHQGEQNTGETRINCKKCLCPKFKKSPFF